jgi:hypothetical protein
MAEASADCCLASRLVAPCLPAGFSFESLRGSSRAPAVEGVSYACHSPSSRRCSLALRPAGEAAVAQARRCRAPHTEGITRAGRRLGWLGADDSQTAHGQQDDDDAAHGDPLLVGIVATRA